VNSKLLYYSGVSGKKATHTKMTDVRKAQLKKKQSMIKVAAEDSPSDDEACEKLSGKQVSTIAVTDR